MDATHPEFAGKFDVESSCDEYLPRDPEIDSHGTAVASIVAGNNNNHCAVGIAPGATISSCVGPDTLDDAPGMLVTKLESGKIQNAHERPPSLLQLSQASSETHVVHISVNSWGPNVCALKGQGRERRVQECMFSSDHPESPCSECDDFTEPTEACEIAVSKYCSRHYEDDIACTLLHFLSPRRPLLRCRSN